MSERKTWVCKFLREFEVNIHAPDLKMAEVLARKVLEQFPAGSVKVLSLLPEDYVEPVDPSPQTSPPKPFNKPTGGGSPGTPVISAPAIVDQIAKVA